MAQSRLAIEIISMDKGGSRGVLGVTESPPPSHMLHFVVVVVVVVVVVFYLGCNLLQSTNVIYKLIVRVPGQSLTKQHFPQQNVLLTIMSCVVYILFAACSLATNLQYRSLHGSPASLDQYFMKLISIYF